MGKWGFHFIVRVRQLLFFPCMLTVVEILVCEKVLPLLAI